MTLRAREMALAYGRRRKDIIYRAPGSKRRRNRLPPFERAKERLISSGGLDEELFSTIPNEITLVHIVPKLPWKALVVLSSVCRRWNRELRAGHRFYEERVRSNSTETLAVVDVTLPNDGSDTIALYSVRDERFYYLPPIPCFRRCPLSFECASLDGKLYVLIGLKHSYVERVSKEVYVLDLVGKRQWRQCTRMRKQRQEFGCAVMDGKIYVLGGDVKHEPHATAEVYDPKLNSWSTIPYHGVDRSRHRVTVVGEELVSHGGTAYTSARFIGDDGSIIPFHYTEEANVLEFYNPVTKEHRSIDSFYSPDKDIVSGTKGNFYSISWEDIHVHHVDDDDAMTHLRSFSAENVLPPQVDVRADDSFVVTVVDDELLAVVHWFDREEPSDGSCPVRWITREGRSDGSCLVRSSGYSTENSEISWAKAPSSGKHESPVVNSIKCSIQL